MPGSINKICQDNNDFFHSPLLERIIGTEQKNMTKALNLRMNDFYSLNNQIRYIDAIIEKGKRNQPFSPLEKRFLNTETKKTKRVLPPDTVALLEEVLGDNPYITQEGDWYYINKKNILDNQIPSPVSTTLIDEGIVEIFSKSIEETFTGDDIVCEVFEDIGIKTVKDIILLDLDTIWKIATRGEIVFADVFAKVKELFDDYGLRFGMSVDWSLNTPQRVRKSTEEIKAILDQTIRDYCSKRVFEYFEAMNIKTVRQIAAIGLDDIGEFFIMPDKIFREIKELFDEDGSRFGMDTTAYE